MVASDLGQPGEQSRLKAGEGAGGPGQGSNKAGKLLRQAAG